MTDKSKIIQHFYNEALKYKTNSEEFLAAAKHVSTLYRDTFGINKTWQDYVKAKDKNVESEIIELFSKMKSELLKKNLP